jgi:hypothetical protein
VRVLRAQIIGPQPVSGRVELLETNWPPPPAAFLLVFLSMFPPQHDARLLQQRELSSRIATEPAEPSGRRRTLRSRRALYEAVSRRPFRKAAPELEPLEPLSTAT